MQTQTRRRLPIWTLFSATLRLMVWKMGKLKAYLRPSLTTFLSKFAWTHGGKTEKNWTGDSFQFSVQYKLTAILRRYIHLTYPRTMGSKNPEKSFQRSESHLSWHEHGKGNKPQAAQAFDEDKEDALFRRPQSSCASKNCVVVFIRNFGLRAREYQWSDPLLSSTAPVFTGAN